MVVGEDMDTTIGLVMAITMVTQHQLLTATPCNPVQTLTTPHTLADSVCQVD